jgi:hypothetical protein
LCSGKNYGRCPLDKILSSGYLANHCLCFWTTNCIHWLALHWISSCPVDNFIQWVTLSSILNNREYECLMYTLIYNSQKINIFFKVSSLNYWVHYKISIFFFLHIYNPCKSILLIILFIHRVKYINLARSFMLNICLCGDGHLRFKIGIKHNMSLL